MKPALSFAIILLQLYTYRAFSDTPVSFEQGKHHFFEDIITEGQTPVLASF